MKALKAILTLFWTGVSLLVIYWFWTGVLPERMKGTSSTAGMELQLEMTGSRGWKQNYKTTLVLKTPDGERFVYDLNELGSRNAVDELIASMSWKNEYVLTFKHPLKPKRVQISYDEELWSVVEEKLNR